MSVPSTWPAVSMEQTRRRLTAADAPFEMRIERICGRDVRTYVRAIPHMRVMFDASQCFGERTFLVYEDERVSFRAHWAAATLLGHALGKQYRIGKGDRVAIAMRNYPEWSICAWAILAIGAVVVPLNAWESGDILRMQIADSGARVVIADEERASRIGDLPHVKIIITRHGSAPDTLEGLIGRPGGYDTLAPVPLSDFDFRPDDPATLFYTSGTTGSSKGVLGTHRNLATNIVNIGYRAARASVRRGGPAELPPPPGVRVQLLPLPLFHVTGFHSSLVPALAGGSRIIFMHKWDVEKALDLIETERVNALTLVPSQSVQLLESPSLAGRDLSSVDGFGYGGASAPGYLAAAVRNRFPAAFAGQGYGATEASSLVAANSAEDMLLRPESVGTAVPGCDIRIVDPVSGKDVAQGAPGEVWVRGANVVTGYWNAPEATEEAFVDGWYRTGDVGRLDELGFLFILDRIKDMLIRGGENIYCAEVENALSSHPSIAEVAVIGVPDRVLGEVVGAVVVPRQRGVFDRSALDRHATDLPVHKRPAHYFVHDGPLPRNAAGKILKRELGRLMTGMGEGS